MSIYTEEQDEIKFSEPVMAQKGVKMKVNFAEKSEWEAKTNGVKDGRKFGACKLTLDIDDDSVRTEHKGGKARMTIEDQFNIQQFPYEDKKTSEQKILGRAKLYQLEGALGFEPIFKVDGEVVEPYITKNGNKVAPKIEGVKRVLNPDFFNTYFSEDGVPNMDNWAGKTIYADLTVEKSEQYGDRNSVSRYVKPPVE